MRYKTRYSVVLLIMISLFASFADAQNNTSSPYSVYGVGDLSSVAYGRNVGLGGTGLALRSRNSLNLKNPASVTAIDSLSVLFETGVFMKYTETESNELLNSYEDGNLSHIALGHRYTSWLMGTYGLMPYSDIGYHFITEKSVEGEETQAVTTWEGSGAINKVFYSLGLKINKNFSIGSEVAFYYGPIKQERMTRARIETDPKTGFKEFSSNYTTFSTNSRYSGFSVKPAIQYTADLGEKGSNLTIGAVYSPKQLFLGESEYTVQQIYGSSSTSSTVFIDDPSVDPLNIPVSYGAGASFTYRGKYLATADYEEETWGAGNSSKYKDRQVYSFGVERLPQSSLNYFERCSYRAGFKYDTGYLTVNRYDITDIRFTLGAGFPIRKSRSTLNVSLEAGQIGKVGSGLIRERYAKISVAFSFHDYWFLERKID
ncbi:MAG: hypothetical protein K9G70_00780 [Prolixibacteraceae bacterium]|nr:hypothetical protein [Prolixibacteraceae bacterium]